MQIAFSELTNEWKALSEIITVESDVKYYIQNRGPDKLLALESSSEPNSLAGNIVLSGDALVYSKGTQDLYLRSFSSTSQINISKEG